MAERAIWIFDPGAKPILVAMGLHLLLEGISDCFVWLIDVCREVLGLVPELSGQVHIEKFF